MTYTNGEMIFFNSILDGEEIFGVKLKEPFSIDEKYIEDTIESLQKKGIIDEKRHLVKTAENPALFIEQYKKARKHIVLNNKRMALCGENYLVVIERKEKEYEVYGINRRELLFEIIKETRVMNEDVLKWENGESSRFNVNEIVKAIKEEEYEYSAIIEKWEKKRKKKEYILLWDEEKAVIYDGLKREKQIVNGNYLRQLLVEILEIKLKGEK